MKKRILAAVVAAAAVMSLAGCNDNNNSSGSTNDNSTPAAGNSTPAGTSAPAVDPAELTDEDPTFSIAAWGDHGDIFTLIGLFEEEYGVTVNFVDCGTGGEAAREQYEKILAGDSTVDVDLIVCDNDWTRNYVESDKTLPMSALGIDASEYKDAYGYTLALGTDNSGVFKAPTYQATPGAFCYRADLAEQYLGVKSPEEMQAKVKDWDTFKATAKELADASGNSCALLDTQTSLWQVFQFNRSKAWVVDGKLEMDTAESFFDFAKDLYDAKGVTRATAWGEGWIPNLQEGKAMGEFAASWGLTGKQGGILGDAAGVDEEGNNPQFQMAVCEGPMAWSWGGGFLAVPTKCNTKKTTADFLRFFTLNEKDGMKKYADKQGDFVNNKSVMNAISAAGAKNNACVGQQDHFAVLSKTVGSIDYTGKVTIYDSKIKSAFNDAVRKYMLGDLGKDEAIKSFKDEVRAAYPDITVE